MHEIRWVSIEVVLAIHGEQIAEHGGADGVRDRGLLESALARPQHQFSFGEPDLFALAAAYAYGIARNHPFVDGNKRTAFVTASLFLWKNGYDLIASDAEAVLTFLGLAAGEVSEEELAAWLRAGSVPRV